MGCCDPAVTRSWRLFRKRFVHIQENCSDFSPRLYQFRNVVSTMFLRQATAGTRTSRIPGRGRAASQKMGFRLSWMAAGVWNGCNMLQYVIAKNM